MKYEEARVLQQRVKRSKECNALLEKLQQQKKELIPLVDELEKSNKKEQSHLKKLQSGNFTSVFYSLIGKKEDKLNEKRWEAAIIKAKYESAVQELRYLEDEIQKTEEELSFIRDCEKEFYAYLKESYELLKTTKATDFVKITELEKEHVQLEHKLVMVQETITLGKDLEWDIHNMLIILDIAEKTKVEIRASKMGSVAQMYEYIDKAQTAAVKLENKLAIFRKKLDELWIDTEIEVDVDAFGHLLDVPMSAALYDDRAMIFAILDKVTIVSKNFRPIKGKLEEIMQKLTVLEEATKQNSVELRQKIEDAIIEFTRKIS